MKINQFIEHTLLKPNTTERQIIDLCNEAKKYNFYAVCVNGCYITLAKQLLSNTEVKIVAVIGFPLGASSTETKVFEAKNAIKNGADEIDMVINIGMLKSKNSVALFKDLSDVKSAIGKVPLKVILEISEISKNEIVKACEICLDAKVDFIKTSTGFSKAGATLTAVKIIKKIVRDKAKIKASGGIKDLETAIKYIDAGADRIGTSSGVAMMTEKTTSDKY
jgi:deoxyribose-phosphate aldolase